MLSGQKIKTSGKSQEILQAVLGAAETNNRPAEIDQSTWDRLIAVYGNSDDIDPFTGGLARKINFIKI